MPEQKDQWVLLGCIAREINKHESALVELRKLERKMIKQYERSKCQAEIDELRALVVNYENGVSGL